VQHAKMGRRTKLTPDLQDRLLGLIRQGNYIDTACKLVGLDRTVIYDWLKRGSKDDPEEPYTSFALAFWEAEGEAEKNVLAIIDKAAAVDWKAAAWKIERRWPERWGRKDRLQAEVTGKDGAEIKVSFDDISDAMKAIAKNAGEHSSLEPGDDDPDRGGSTD